MAKECIGISDDSTLVKTAKGKDTIIASDVNPTRITSQASGKVTVIQEDKAPTHLVDGSTKSKISVDIIPEAIKILDPGLPWSLPANQGDKNFVYSQNIASAQWTVNHLLGKKVAVTVVDSGGTTIEGDVDYVSDDKIVINFSAPFTGQCFCN